MQENLQERLIIAIDANNLEQFQNLLDTATEVQKANAAILAAFANKITMVQAVIEKDANINHVDKDGNSCLHWAAYRNNPEMIQLVLAQGAKNQADKNGKTPMHIAEENGYTEAFALLLQHFWVSQNTLVITDDIPKSRAPLREYMINEQNINNTDKEGRTCLHWAVHYNYLEMIPLLLARGANHQEDKNGKTPAHLAEAKGYIEAFALLVQHFLMAPFKLDDQKVLAATDDIFEEEKNKKSISADTLNLLIKFQIKKQDMDLAGIELEDLERAAHPTYLGKLLYFIVSANIVRTLMLWPFMLRGSIKLDEETKSTPEKKFPRNRKYKEESELIITVSEKVGTRPVLVNEVETEVEKQENQRFLEPDTLVVTDDMEQDDPSSKISQSIRCSFPLLTSSGLLFQSENVLRGIAAVHAFHETVDTLINGVWNAFLSSLVINGIVNYYLYPEEREENGLLDTVGITGLRNIACIRSIDTIKNSILCSPGYTGYDDILSSALGNYYVWPFIAGIPLLFGVMNATHASWKIKPLSQQDVNDLILQLRIYKPGYWADGIGWLFTAAIPDLFPPAAVLFMLPQPVIKQTLEKFKQTIIWDGRLKAQHRKQLFEALVNFARHRSQFTQMKAMSMLAEIVDGIHYKNLPILKEEGIDDETLKALITIKATALKELGFLADHYNLPDTPKSLFRPLFRYLYANYLMWRLGYPQQNFLQPLFFAIKGIKLYYTLIFYKAIIGGIIEIINQYLDEQECIVQGKKWTWIDPWQNYSCTYCGDLPIGVRSISSPSDCLTDYLKNPRNLNQLLNIFARFNASQLYNFNTLDLSNQNKIIKEKNLPFLLKFLTFKGLKISAFVLNKNRLSYKDIEAIFDFSNNSFWFNKKIDWGCHLYLTDGTFESGGIKLLADGLQNNHKIRDLYLYNNNLTATDAIILAQGLRKSKVEAFWLDDNPIGDIGIQAIAENLPSRSSYVYVRIRNCNITSVGCIALINASIHLNKRIGLLISYNPIDSICAEAIATALYRIGILELGEGGYIDDVGINALAHAFKKGNANPISLFLTGYNASIDVMSTLIDSLSQAPRLQEFRYFDNRFNGNFNYSALIPKLIDAINKSKTLTSFGWEGRNGFGWGDKEAELFASFIQKGQAKNLGVLWLNDNRIGPTGMYSIACALPKTNLWEISFNNNIVGAGIISLAKYLNVGVNYSLAFDNNNITTSDISTFSSLLDFRQISFHGLSSNNNSINNEGVIKLIKLYRSRILPLCTVLPFQSLFGTTCQILQLDNTHINAEGAILIANTLVERKHSLWINALNYKKSFAQAESSTNLISLSLSNNFLGNTGTQAICDALSYTHIGRNRLMLDNTGTDTSILENCGILSSDAHSLQYELFYPYLLLYRNFRAAQESFYAVLYSSYYKEKETLSVGQITIKSDASSMEIINIINTSSHVFYENSDVLDASHYSGSGTFFIDLNSKCLKENHDEDFMNIPFLPNTVGVRGSVHRNNVIIGNEEILIDVSQSHRTNFLQPGKNNLLRLGFFSTDHVVVSRGQETVDIHGFDANKDTLHLISENTIYIKNNITICQNEILENDMPAAVICLQETTVQLLNTRCEDIENNIEINNNEALDAAYAETIDAVEHHDSSILYASVLMVCETFVNSVSASALFTAVPMFVSEILYCSGGYTREETEKFGQEIQTLLILSFTDSPHAMAANLLASWLTSRLIDSPNMIAAVGMSASIVATVAGSALSANMALGQIVLQTGFALMGSLVGSYSVCWGMNKMSSVKDYLSSKMCFWSSYTEEATIEEIVLSQNVVLDVSQDSAISRLGTSGY